MTGDVIFSTIVAGVVTFLALFSVFWGVPAIVSKLIDIKYENKRLKQEMMRELTNDSVSKDDTPDDEDPVIKALLDHLNKSIK